MKLYIPEIGDQITLTKEWSFHLYPETRNETLGLKMNLALKDEDMSFRFVHWIIDGKTVRWVEIPDDFSYEISFPAGTILKIDRIYIRKGNSKYSSLSFYIKNGEYKGARFWAKLNEVNQIEFK